MALARAPGLNRDSSRGNRDPRTERDPNCLARRERSRPYGSCSPPASSSLHAISPVIALIPPFSSFAEWKQVVYKLNFHENIYIYYSRRTLNLKISYLLA